MGIFWTSAENQSYNDKETQKNIKYIYIYSGAKKYLVSHQLCKFSHLKRWERIVYLNYERQNKKQNPDKIQKITL